jgi:hypothetical protein
MSTNPREGFFRQRDVDLGGPFSQEWVWVDHRTKFTIVFDWFPTLSTYSPLYGRGWVVQERLISPRTMHFATYPFWECNQTVCCELYPSESYHEKYNWLPLPEKNIAGHRTAPEETWFRIIEHYSSCELTHIKDKLIALCGVAKMLSPFLGEKYIAGLWESDLLRGLLWQVRKQISGNDFSAERPSQYIGEWKFSIIVPYSLNHDSTILVMGIN